LGGPCYQIEWLIAAEQCPNDNGKLYAVAGAKTQAWENVFLSEPVKRLQKDFAGYTLTPRDIKDFMEVSTESLLSVV